MITFTHNNPNDTFLEKDGDTIHYAFYGNMFTLEEQDRMDFQMSQDQLFVMLGEYFDEGKHADLFDNLTLPGQDALWNALYRLNDQNIKL